MTKHTQSPSDVMTTTVLDLVEPRLEGLTLRAAAKTAPFLATGTLRDILERPAEMFRMMSLTPALGPKSMSLMRKIIIATIMTRHPDEWDLTVEATQADSIAARRRGDGAGIDLQRVRSIWEIRGKEA